MAHTLIAAVANYKSHFSVCLSINVSLRDQFV